MPCTLLLAVEDDYPVFGELQDIFVTRTSEVVFRVRLCQTTYFNHHHHAYIVNPTNSYRNVPISELYHPFTHCIKQLTNRNNYRERVIVLKYHICGTVLA